MNMPTPQLNLFGVVGEAFTDASVADWLTEHADAEALTVKINSPGGSLLQGAAIFNALSEHPAEVTVHIVGSALSAASYIAMAGDKIVMASNAVMMLHDPSLTATGGNATDLRREADTLDRLRETMVGVYSARTGLDAERIRSMLAAEGGAGTWLSAEEAVELGFADEIAQTRTHVAALVGEFQPPARFAAQFTPKEVSPMTDTLTAHAAEFERHPQFFFDCVKAGKTLADARKEYTAHLLAENERLAAEIEKFEARAKSYEDGADPVTVNPQARIDYDGEPDEPGDDDAYRAEWSENRQLRKEFAHNYDVYSAYRKAADAGLVRSPRKA